MSWRERLSNGLSKSRRRLTESMNVMFHRGVKLDDEFWDGLEETLILGDLGGRAADEVVENLKDKVRRQAIPDAKGVLAELAAEIAALFAPCEVDPLDDNPTCVLFVGINGAGKTTTVGKLAKVGVDEGRQVLIGSADTFRAAAIEQLHVWADRSDVEVVEKERGSDPASVCYATVERAEELGSDLVLIDTSGRLHTSADLMRELQKMVNVTRKRSRMPVRTLLVMDATTGQNGLAQAREFHKALNLDGIVLTKLDGTAKGGIAVAASHELGLPIVRIGVGESIDDLRPFDAHEFAEALIGSSEELLADE